MRRSLALLVFCALLTASGGALAGFAATLRATPVIPSPGANPAIAQAFYAAVDAVLAGDDRARLDALLAPGFAWRTAPPGVSPDADGLVSALAALRAVAPGTRFSVGTATAAGPWVAAPVAPSGTEDAAFLGTPLPPSLAVAEAFGLLRVEGGLVAEYWGGPSGPVLTPLLRTTVPVASPARRGVTLERWSYAPGAAEAPDTHLAAILLLVDAGELTVDVAPTANALRVIGGGTTVNDDRNVLPGTSIRLSAGDALVVPQGSRFALRNGGTETAVALVVVVAAPALRWTAEAGPAPVTPGITHAVLAGGLAATLPEGQATVAIGRAVLAPGSGLPAHRVGVGELAVVEAGTLVLDADGDVWITAALGSWTKRAESGEVPAGGGAQADVGTVVEERAGGQAPLTMLLVVLGDGHGPESAAVETRA